MSTVKVSDFPHFNGQWLLLEAQKRGARIALGTGIGNAQDLLLLGLAEILVERGIVEEKDEPA